MNASSSGQGALFPAPGPTLVDGLARLQTEIRKAYPLKSKHRAVLPGGIRRLSAFLTVEREKLPPDYMSRPEYIAAYLNYFLPWNVFRQGRLLQGLDLDLPADARILDLGSGPLTFLQALWLSRPHLRLRTMNYLAVDRAEPALKSGRKIFEGLTADQEMLWQVHASRQLTDKRRQAVDLLVAANFINEVEGDARGRDRRNAAEAEQESAEDRLLDRWENQVKDNGAILLIEPAMRATARRLSRLRQVALQRGWQVAAPCPHQVDCPMPGVRGGPWCHFNFKPIGAPEWLTSFSRSVRLPKERGSLSFLLLTRGENCRVKIFQPKKVPGLEQIRVISEPFDLPGWQQGCYGCTSQGTVLLRDRKSGSESLFGPQPGDLLQAEWPAKPEKDQKSGAVILHRKS